MNVDLLGFDAVNMQKTEEIWLQSFMCTLK